MKKSTRILKTIGNVLLWAFVVFSVVVTVLVLTSQNSKSGLPNLFGKSMINILTQSMEPTIKQYDLIFADVLDDEQKQNLKVDDIVTFISPDLDGDNKEDLNTHRIIEVIKNEDSTTYITHGDYNPADKTESVDSNAVVAKFDGTIWTGFGKVMNFLQSQTGFLIVIVLPLVLFFIFELVNVILLIYKAKNKGKVVSKETEDEIKKRAIEEYLKQQAIQNGDNTATQVPVEDANTSPEDSNDKQ